ncbi:MAG: protease [Geobacteraceae bacterium]|nr:MAG: protease [Geobacteraceae bacterium]
MRNKTDWLGMIIVALLLNGCAFINVEMMRPVSPLQERVVEGEGRPKVLMLDISGFISEKEKSGGPFQVTPSIVSTLKEALQKAEKDEDIAGVIVRINSPGGTVTASDIIHHELLNFKSRKKVPVYACIVGIGASGGYYVATAADEIIVHPTAITGSIGVLVMRFNVEGLLAKVGVSEQTIKSGDKKDIMSPFRPATPEEQQIMQTIINRLYGRFVDVVQARSKNTLDRKQIELLADGRIYTADQALDAKLIDRIGYLDDAVATMKKALGIEQARVVSYYRPGGYKGTIYSGAPVDGPQIVNLVNINADGLELLSGMEFMYLWRQ